jgi:endogenous inhibitor of DNA gyrase (YacG/DUF329 family)
VFGRLLEFEWERFAAYEIVAPCEFTCSDGELKEFGRRIIHRMTEGDVYLPLRKYPDLYRVFANVKNDEGLLAFIRLYGPLTDEGHVASNETPGFTSEVFMLNGKKVAEKVYVPGDLIDRCLERAAWCKNVLKFQADRSDRFMKLIEEVEHAFPCHLIIEADRVNGAQLVLEPKSLLDAILLQLMESVRTGVHSAECENCGEWFGKKAGAKFCSVQCKDIHHNNQKRNKRIAEVGTRLGSNPNEEGRITSE